jgi:outer membrane protein TolC
MSPRTTTCILVLLLASRITYAEEPAGGPPPLSIAEAKALAKKNNTSLQSLREKLVQANIQIDKAWVMYKPQWNAGASYVHYNEGVSFNTADLVSPVLTALNLQSEASSILKNYPNVVIQQQDTFAAQTSITQPIFLARAFTTIKSAYKGYDLAKLTTENAQDYLLNNVELAYYGALTAQKFVDIAEESLQIRKEHLRDATSKFEVGDSTKFNVLRAEIDANNAEEDLKRAQNSLSIAKEIVRLLCGMNKEEFSLVEPEPLKPPQEDIDAFINRALKTRRDLRSARLSLELGELANKDAWFRFLPTLGFTGTFSWANIKGFSDKYYTWNVMFGLSVPLYDGGLRYAFINEARSQIRDAEIQIEDTTRSIRSEIRQLWLTMEMASANLEKARQSSVLAKEQVELARSSFEAGAVTNLEVLDANSTLFISRMNEAQEELNLEVSIFKLFQALTTFNPSVSTTASANTTAASGGGAPTSMSGGASSPTMSTTGASPTGAGAPSGPGM